MTVDFDAGPTLADRFRAHAGDHEHFNAYAMRGMADDWEAGGPVRQVCAGYEDSPRGSVIQLRLLAGVFRLVLTGRAPSLLPFYACLGGTAAPRELWPVMRQVIADHLPDLRQALTIPPQTNEVGRSAALLAGLFDLVAATGLRRIRLLEVGASGGLNLLLDRFAFTGEDTRTGQTWSWGSDSSPVRLDDAISGPLAPTDFMIISRRGCDPDPVDVTTADGRLLLTSFVWPFQLDRHARLAAALELAQQDPPVVDRATASRWLPGQLEQDGGEEMTVVWQSVTRLYWPAEETAAVDRTLTAVGRHRPLGHVAMEYAGVGTKPSVTTSLWLPGGSVRQRNLGSAHDHGIPVRAAAES
jgi:hypothetical protein